MKDGRKSTADEAQQCCEEYEEEGEAEAFCKKHVSSSQLPYSVCAICLREKLLRLCPDCATLRPCSCPCQPSRSAASSTASSSLSSSYGSGRSRTTTAVRFGNGADRMCDLIASEPAFVRSKSAGYALRRDGSVKGLGVSGLVRSRSVAVGGVGGGGERKKRRWNWAAIWPFKGGEDKVEKWKWWFPSPIRGFNNYRKSSASRAVVV
ncbi:hypothetical protein LUZ60_016943 [Juncus effusus]|nr:hypothetical protein LUZ60_016943 [Juncus effusus]